MRTGLSMLATGLTAAMVAPGAPDDADTLAYFAAWTSPPTAHGARWELVNTLIVGLKADGVWPLLDRLWLAQTDEQATRLDVRNPAKSLVATNSPTFLADRGFTGDGATSYLSFNEVPAATGNAFSLDSAAFGVYCNQQTGSGARAHVGPVSGAQAMISPSSNSTDTYRANDVTSGTIPNAATRLGFRQMVRESAAQRRFYLDGVDVANDTTASTAIPTSPLCFGRSASAYSADRFAAGYSGGALTAAKVAAMDARVTAYLTAIGGN